MRIFIQKWIRARMKSDYRSRYSLACELRLITSTRAIASYSGSEKLRSIGQSANQMHSKYGLGITNMYIPFWSREHG